MTIEIAIVCLDNELRTVHAEMFRGSQFNFNDDRMKDFDFSPDERYPVVVFPLAATDNLYDKVKQLYFGNQP